MIFLLVEVTSFMTLVSSKVVVVLLEFCDIGLKFCLIYLAHWTNHVQHCMPWTFPEWPLSSSSPSGLREEQQLHHVRSTMPFLCLEGFLFGGKADLVHLDRGQLLCNLYLLGQVVSSRKVITDRYFVMLVACSLILFKISLFTVSTFFRSFTSSEINCFCCWLGQPQRRAILFGVII
jgi:hypothetical protein